MTEVSSPRGRISGRSAAQMMLLTDREFRKFSSLIYDTCGIKLSPIKKTMLSSRLHKRLRALDMNSFTQYLEYILSPQGSEEEFMQLLDVVTTNKTEFFREPDHFAFLTERILPEYMQHRAGIKGSRHRLRIWSAGCSSGEEPYTLGMVLAEYAARTRGFDFSILATDISTRVLAAAEQAVYPNERLAGIPRQLLQRYFLRGIGSQRNFHRVIPELRQKLTFRRLNLKEDDFRLRQSFDIIFCRNVIIYFDRSSQAGLVDNFYRQLALGGYLLIGHSETLEGIHDRLRRVAPTVYRK